MVILGGYHGYTPSQKLNKMGASEGVEFPNTYNKYKWYAPPL